MPETARRMLRYIWLACFAGLLAGLLEAAVRGLLLPWAPPYRIRLGAYLLWMPATANLILFFVVGVALGLLAMVRPARMTTRGSQGS